MSEVESLPERGPRCPSCHVEVTDDGDVRTCPRCGRAFTVALACIGDGPVYRRAPDAELVPADIPAPDWSCLRFSDTSDALWFEFGNASTAASVRALAIGTSIVFAILTTIAAVFESIGSAAPLALISVLFWLAGRVERPRPGRFDRLVVRGGFLEVRPASLVGESPPKMVRLDDIVGVHEGHDHLTVSLRGNDEFQIATEIGRAHV